MKHLSITLPDSLYMSILTLFKSIPDITVKEDAQTTKVAKATQDPYNISQAHQDLVLHRIATDTDDDILDWSEAKKTLKRK